MTRSTRRRYGTRQLQRLFHLATAAGIVTYVYFTPDPNAPMALGIRWIALPTLVVSGLAMWLWPRVRRRLKAGRDSGGTG